MFYIFHSAYTTRVFDWALFGAAGLVQLIKISNFLSHKTGHSQYEKQSTRHKCLSFIGLVVAFASLCMLITNMILLSYYESIGGIIILVYEGVQTFVMLPVLHLMIINQEAHGQRQFKYETPADSLNQSQSNYGNVVY